MSKLLVGALVVFGGLVLTTSLATASQVAWITSGTAPATVLQTLSKARYAKSLSPGDVQVIFAWEGLPAGRESALSWVRAEQGRGRVVLVPQSFQDDLESGVAVYSFPNLDRAQETLKGAFWVLSPA